MYPMFSCTHWTTFANKVETLIGFRPNAASGIFCKGTVAVLRSVDGTPHYHDELNYEMVDYMLHGPIGDQSLETRSNKMFLRATEHYVYRVQLLSNNTKRYIWYGKYLREGDIRVERHVDITGCERRVYVQRLVRCEASPIIRT